MLFLRFMVTLLACGWIPMGTVGAESLESRARTATESARTPTRYVDAPLPVSIVSGSEIRPLRPTLGLDEGLTLVPGVFGQSAGNFAQDTRIAIRGFGARAPFGIRGLGVMVDRFPTTLPDGQSEIDSIDLDFVDRIEVIRGPVSSLYGSSGGGTISLFTLAPSAHPRVRVRSLFGASHMQRWSAVMTGTAAETGYMLGLASTRTRGYRDHSRTEQYVGLAKLERTLSDGTLIELQGSLVQAPEAQDPGALKAIEVAQDRRAANPRSLKFDAGEKLDQQKIGLHIRHPFGSDRELQISAYHVWRDFRNRLPTPDKRVGFNRRVLGGSLQYLDGSGPVFWTSGIDIGVQNDHRRNWRNPSTGQGALTLEQRESVRSIGSFVQGQVDLGSGFGLTTGLRYDWTEFGLADSFLSDGDQSDRLRFHEWSPRITVHYGHSSRFRAYATYGTAFRVPTTTELAPSDASGGFDKGIGPEHTAGVEFGIKGLVGKSLVYDAAVFELRIRNALIPFTDEAQPDQTFYRNAGEVRRRGIEIGLSALLHPGLSSRLVYTYSHYRYHHFDRVTRLAGGGQLVTDLAGKTEPNTPAHVLNAEIRFEHSGFFGVFALRWFSDIAVDDANRVQSGGATISDIRAGYRWKHGGTTLTPLIGLENWTGAKYNGTLRPNGGFGRYFEPAAGTMAYIGIELAFTPNER